MATTYTVEGKSYTVRSTDGTSRFVEVPDLTFRSGMEMLHWAIADRIVNSRVGGLVDTVLNIYLGSDRDAHRGYRITDSFSHYKLTNEHRDAMKAAQDRLRTLDNHFREVAPGWTDLGKVYYADNSVVMQQRSADGRFREITLVAPHGDVC